MIPGITTPVSTYDYHSAPLALQYLAEVFSLEETLKLDRRCFACNTTTTSKWIKNSSGEDQCNKCYYTARRILALSGNSGKTCSTCNTTTTTQWYRNSSSKDQCNKCYWAARKSLSLSGILGKTCFACNTTTTIQWYKGLLNQDQCQKCYQAARRELKRKADTLEVVNAKIPRLNETPFAEREFS